jgi:hypothetical protein
MKKTLLASVFAFVIAVSCVFAGSADLFSYDHDQLNNDFAELNLLENYIKNNEGITLTNLVNENHPLIAGITVRNPFAPAIPFEEPPLGIPSFWWGCCIGVWGIAVVYFITEDKEETKQALKGCVVNTIIGLVLYVGLYVWILGNTAYWY